VKRVFLTSAALVDSMPGPEDENGKLLQSGMREIVRRVALAFHVAIPPSGQVPIQSKH
jgi:hypothetical protein